MAITLEAHMQANLLRMLYDSYSCADNRIQASK
jgi:hypothetical protein